MKMTCNRPSLWMDCGTPDGHCIPVAVAVAAEHSNTVLTAGKSSHEKQKTCVYCLCSFCVKTFSTVVVVAVVVATLQQVQCTEVTSVSLLGCNVASIHTHTHTYTHTDI